MYSLNNNVTYFNSFGVEHISKEIKTLIGNINTMGSMVRKNLFRIQAYGSVICGYCCIGFIDFMFKGIKLTNFTNHFSTNDFKKMMI